MSGHAAAQRSAVEGAALFPLSPQAHPPTIGQGDTAAQLDRRVEATVKRLRCAAV
jgi:hypothetical protein